MTKEKNLKRFLLTISLFFAGTVLSEVFVNIYLWKLKSDFTPICVYLIACYITVPLVFYLCGYIGMRLDRVKLYIAGIFSYAAFYLLVLIFREKVIDHLVLIGIIKGIAMGLYWFGYHILTIDYTEHGKRDSFYSTTSVISGSASMIGPLIAGLIIKTAPGLSGYYTVFAMTSFLLLVAAVMITPLKSTPIKKPYKIEDLIFTKNKKWRNTMIAYVFLSGKDAIMMFMMAVLVVRATGSELTFGGFATLVSGMAILTAFLMGKFSRPGMRKYLVFSGAALSFLASLLLVYKISFPTLIIYGLVGAVADYLVRIPFSAYSMDLISLDASVNERKMEYIAARDVPIAAGRILTLLLFLFLLKNMDLAAIKVIIPLISSFLFAVYWAMYK
jgi:MFS transporter, YQGE family, putative transporter